MNLRLPSLAPVVWLTLEKVTQQLLWLILFAILAPILGPRPYGLFAIVMVFVGLCELILFEGAIEALVTVAELDSLHMTTANLANGGVALALSAIVAVLAPAIGILFQDAEITHLMWFLTPLPILSALSAVPIALLRRSFQYRKLAIRSIVGLMIGGICGISLALAGFGVWALAGQLMVQRASEFVIAWSSVPVRIGFTWSKPHFREMSPVALNVFVGRIMIFAGGQLPRVILGYALGPTELGLFTLANRLMDIILQVTVLPLTDISRIELRASRPGTPEFINGFARVANHVTLLAFPIFCGAAALTPDLFHAWLDHRWLGGIRATQWILLSGMPLVFFYCMDAVFLATNLSRLFTLTAIAQAATVTATVLICAPFGLDVTCFGLIIRGWLLVPAMVWLLHRFCGLPVRSMLWSPSRSFLGAALLGGVLALPFLRPHGLSEATTFALLFVIAGALYFLLLLGLQGGQIKPLITAVFARR